ncbi:3'-5' exonuclease [Paeniglutamicibacter sp. ORCA_105]|uniref:3'-5' exonuclease n=1 Tax=Paeniglutamicibacter sp. ORCA_105 TaxID=3377336 RepID=UPI003895BD97
MNSWHNLPRAAFDLETTGRDPLDARIVTASIVVVNGRSEILQTRDWLVDPGVAIPEEASAIHGITTAKAQAEGMDSATAVAEISAFLADLFQTMPVMAFNAAYDFTVLDREAKRHLLDPLVASPVIDPYVLDKQVDKYRRGKRNLSVMSEFYGVQLVNAHTSAADAAATIGIADAQAAKYPNLQIDAAELHDFQVDWAAEQAASLQEFFRRKDPAAVVDGQWPVKA